MINDNSYLWAWKRERNETLHIHMYNMACYCSVCNLEVTNEGKALQCDEC